jgi:hypothetical protein
MSLVFFSKTKKHPLKNQASSLYLTGSYVSIIRFKAILNRIILMRLVAGGT